jgi:ribonuclease Z
LKLWEPEFKQRIAHERRTSTAALSAEVIEIETGEVTRAGDLVITAVDVDHYPVRPAFAFLFESPESRLAISGDTTYCPALIEACKSFDVLVHEVYIHSDESHQIEMRQDLGSRNVMSYHTASDVVGQVALEAEVGVLVLNHFVPTRFDEESLLQQVCESFPGPVTMSDSGVNALRSVLDIRVIAPAKASYMMCLLLGSNFGVLTQWDRWNIIYKKPCRNMACPINASAFALPVCRQIR